MADEIKFVAPRSGGRLYRSEHGISDKRYAEILAGESATPKETKIIYESKFMDEDIFGFSYREIILGVIAWKVAQTPQGLKALRDIAVALINQVGATTTALAKASVGNPISAWANPYLLSIIYEQFGIVPHERMAEFRLGLSLVSGAEIAEDIAVSIAGFLGVLGKAPPSEFPTHIDFGSKTHHVTIKEVPIPEKKKKKKE